MAIERYKIEEFLYTSCNKVKRSGNGYVLRCPVCGDSKKNPNKRRCHVDYYSKYDEWVYTCYNGGCPQPSGNIQSLYAHVNGVSWKEANDELSEKKYDADKIKDRLDRRKKFEDEKDETGELDLNLNECYKLDDEPDGRKSQRYIQALKTFHVNRLIPLKYKVIVAHSGKYMGRYIIPVYNNGEMVYFQGRAMSDDIEPKYLNPDVKKEEIIPNIDKFDVNRHIIICEGLLDAYSVEGYQGTSCIGASISDDYLSRIFALNPRMKPIIALDNPLVDESGMRNYKKIMDESRYAKRLKYFFMPGNNFKDLNDVRVKKGVHFNIYDFVASNSYDHFSATLKLNKSFYSN